MEPILSDEQKLGVDNSSAREATFRINTDPDNIICSILALPTIGSYEIQTAPTAADVTLPGLFTKYFKGLANKEYTQDDIADLVKLDPDIMGARYGDRRMYGYPTKQPINRIARGMYLYPGYGKDVKRAFMTFRVTDLGSYARGVKKVRDKFVIGASSIDRGIYFIFDNTMPDVNNGRIFVRDSNIGKIKLLSTFEVNPFVKHNIPVMNKETGVHENKDTVTFNPHWLAATLYNMELKIFNRR